MRRYTIVVPDALDKVTAEHSAIVRAHVAHTLSGIFGGYSAYRGDGGWVDDAGNLITEPHTSYQALDDSVGTDADIRQQAIRDLALRVKADLQQDCVLVVREAVRSIEFV